MRSGVIFIAAVVLAGCDKPAPRMSEDMLAKIKSEMPGLSDACLDKIRKGGIEAMPEPVDQCFEMTEQKRWQGYWRYGLETSLFCAAPAKDCPVSDDNIWLSFSNPKLENERREWGLYEVEVVGRMTAQRAAHGHNGMANRELVVDRVISLRNVPDGAKE